MMCKICYLFSMLLLVGFVASCGSSQVQDTTVPLYIGTYTSGSSEGIYMARFDTVSGKADNLQLLASVDNPSFLTLDANGKLLFAVSEHTNNKPNLYSLHRGRSWELADSLATGALASCYVSIVGKEMLAIANYVSGDVSFVSFNNKGRFIDEVAVFKHVGSGANAARQEAPHAHAIVADKEGRFVYAADLGIDKVMIYERVADTFVPAGELVAAPGAGPRHIAVHPQEKILAVINELNLTIDFYLKDERGAFTIYHSTVSLLGDEHDNGNSAADIHFSPDGRFLYGSVRGADKIVIFQVFDGDDLNVRHRGDVSEGINWPRNFTIDPNGRFLLVANQNGNSVVVLHRDAETGMLRPSGHRLEVSMPVCLKF
ncbi:lactonase family protein [Alkaliflexus imshenetskii]|uniref:lactonase family protein n=1 Tax=Alkaliflexus imshenetskii TaxID=286730 RepID=UPI0004BCCB10|nr:lactonase family protein [Alkaliflexus imshenetskii]